jgi:iron complex transport system permease protein
MPAAALAGGAFLVICDILARLPEREIPLGVITGLIGAPVFLALLVRARRQGAYG